MVRIEDKVDISAFAFSREESLCARNRVAKRQGGKHVTFAPAPASDGRISARMSRGCSSGSEGGGGTGRMERDDERMMMLGNGGMEEEEEETEVMEMMPSSMGRMDESSPCGRGDEKMTGVKEGMCVWNWILILLVASVIIGAIVKATSSKGGAEAKRRACKYSLR